MQAIEHAGGLLDHNPAMAELRDDRANDLLDVGSDPLAVLRDDPADR
jgi:hypothetical protein